MISDLCHVILVSYRGPTPFVLLALQAALQCAAASTLTPLVFVQKTLTYTYVQTLQWHTFHRPFWLPS